MSLENLKLELKKARNFWFLKEEADLLNSLVIDLACEDMEDTKDTVCTYYETVNSIWNLYEIVFGGTKKKVVTKGKKANLSWLIREAQQIKVALTNLAYTAKKLPTVYSAKTKKSMFFIGSRFNNLCEEETLLKVAQACETMSARCMKAYRKSKAPCCKRYYSMFRAMEQQAERLHTRLEEWTR